MSSTVYHIEVNWANGAPTRHLILDEDLRYETFRDWADRFLVHSTRPTWVRAGDLVFHTQTVQSIEVLDQVEHEEGN